MDSVERVYRYLAARTEISPDNVIDYYGDAQLTVEDLRVVLRKLRELGEQN